MAICFLCLGYNFDATTDSNTEKAILMYHRIVEAFKFAYAKRSELGDMEFVNVTDVSNNTVLLERIRTIQ